MHGIGPYEAWITHSKGIRQQSYSIIVINSIQMGKCADNYHALLMFTGRIFSLFNSHMKRIDHRWTLKLALAQNWHQPSRKNRGKYTEQKKKPRLWRRECDRMYVVDLWEIYTIFNHPFGSESHFWSSIAWQFMCDLPECIFFSILSTHFFLSLY